MDGMDEQRTACGGYPLARRGMVMTGLISGFTLATQRVEAQAIHTDTTGHRGRARSKIPTDRRACCRPISREPAGRRAVPGRSW